MYYPGEIQLKDLYKNCHDSLLTSTRLKLKESNKMKSSLADPHSRTVIIPEIHKLVFAGAFSSKFLPTERSLVGIDLKQSSPRFNLDSIIRVDEVFQGAVTRIHGSGDTTVVTPWYHITTDEMGSNSDDFLQKGTLLLPIQQNHHTIKCFVPCAGLDPETDNIPTWCESYKINDVLPNINIKDLYPIRKAGIGKLSAINKQDYSSIPSGQIEIGDVILCRGQWMEVLVFGGDAFYTEGAHDIVRFTKNFTKNINKQKYDIMKWPIRSCCSQ